MPDAKRLMIDETPIRQLLAANRPREAFDQIVAQFRVKIFHLALSLTRNEAAAADLAQDALFRVWKALPAYNGTASLSTWIYTIARNVCLTELSRAARRPTVSLDAPESTGTVESLVAPEPAAAGTGQDLDAMLARLPDKYRQVLQLFYLQQKSHEETAALLGMPIGTVKTFLFRARKELAQMAAREPHESASR